MKFKKNKLKKINFGKILQLLFLFVFLILAVSCSKGNSSNSKDKNSIYIKENVFIAQTNDIYFNPNDYFGKTIKYEGFFQRYEAADGEPLNLVIRYGPGCCAIDGIIGFLVSWDKGYPNDYTWLEIEGKLDEEIFKKNGSLVLQLTSLTPLEKRGKETVHY